MTARSFRERLSVQLGLSFREWLSTQRATRPDLVQLADLVAGDVPWESCDQLHRLLRESPLWAPWMFVELEDARDAFHLRGCLKEAS